MRALKFLTLFFSAFTLILSADILTHSFKAYNFRIELPSDWNLSKSRKHSKSAIYIAKHEKSGITYEIKTKKRKEDDLEKELHSIIKAEKLSIENFSKLSQEPNSNFQSLEGFHLKFSASIQNKNSTGYFIFGSDGVNSFQIKIYTPEELFEKNFKTMKTILSGFSINSDFKQKCCDECKNISKEFKGNYDNCSEFTSSEDCSIYFRFKPTTLSQCK